MNLQVLKISPIKQDNFFQIIIKVGEKIAKFTMEVETEELFNQTLNIIKGDANFHSLFEYNRDLAQKIYNLVAQVYQQESINFPVNLGEFIQEKEPVISG